MAQNKRSLQIHNKKSEQKIEKLERNDKNFKQKGFIVTWRTGMRDADFLRAILETSMLYVNMIEQSTSSGKQEEKRKTKPLKFGFCKCRDCESLKWIAHANKRKRLILVSKEAFEKELNNRANMGMGFFILIYAMMHAYLEILHPYSKEKTIELKANRYFKKAMQIVTKDGLKVIMNKVSV